GAFDAARDVLMFLSEHLDESGRAPGRVTLAGEARYDDPDATALYLVLTARYPAWTGDRGVVRAGGPRVRAGGRHVSIGCEQGREAMGHAGVAANPATGIASIALAELAVAAESIGDAALAEALRSRAIRPGAPTLPSFLGAAGAAWAEFAAGRSDAATR